MKKLMTILFIIFSMIACNGEEKSQTKATANEYKFVDVDTLSEKYVEKYLYTIKWKEEDLKYKGEYVMWYAKMDEKGNLYIIANENKKMYFYNEKGCLNKEYELPKNGYFEQIQFGVENIMLKGEDIRNGNLIFEVIDTVSDSCYNITFDKKTKEIYNENYVGYRYILTDSANKIVFDSESSNKDTFKDIEMPVKTKNRVIKVEKITFIHNAIKKEFGVELKLPQYLDSLIDFEIPDNLSFFNFIGRDEEGNLYIVADIQKTSLGEGPENYYCYLFKYSYLGVLLSAFQMKNGESKNTPKLSYTYVYSNRDIYRVNSYGDGIKVYKYERM